MLYECIGGPLDGMPFDGLDRKDGEVVQFPLTCHRVKFAKNYEWPVYELNSHPLFGTAHYEVAGVALSYLKTVGA